MAEEGYLPVTWTAVVPATRSTLSSQIDAIDQPPAGSFHWEYPNLPTALQTLWVPGQWTVITQGAVMQFQRVNGLTVNGEVSATLWRALIDDRLRDRKSPDGYTYISVTENQPETLELWVNGKLFLKSAANTGISVTPTQLGTYAIYERLPFQVMQGLNPDGVPYADPVHWINYFYGGDAVHGFPRASYGFSQSLGCVEVPLNVAPTVYHTVHYGTLVTVNPPESHRPGQQAARPSGGGSAWSLQPSRRCGGGVGSADAEGDDRFAGGPRISGRMPPGWFPVHWLKLNRRLLQRRLRLSLQPALIA